MFSSPCAVYEIQALRQTDLQQDISIIVKLKEEWQIFFKKCNALFVIKPTRLFNSQIIHLTLLLNRVRMKLVKFARFLACGGLVPQIKRP